MPDVNAKGPIREGWTEVVVTRADGTVDRFGVVTHTKWKRWGIHAWLAKRRIQKINLKRGFNRDGTVRS